MRFFFVYVDGVKERRSPFYKIVFWGFSSLSFFCLLAPLDYGWDSLGLCFRFCPCFKTFLKRKCIFAVARFCFIRVVSFLQILQHTPFCPNFAKIKQQGTSSLPTSPSEDISSTIGHVVAGLRVWRSRRRSSPETSFIRKKLFCMIGIRNPRFHCISVLSLLQQNIIT